MSEIYDDDNIFAKILRGEIPSHKVYEDADTYVLMDIFPRCDGHCLVIPKAPARNILDVETTALEAVARTTQKIARAAKKAFDADGISIVQSNEKAGNQEVFHLHVHIMPRYNGVPLGKPAADMADGEVLAEHAKRIAAAIGG